MRTVQKTFHPGAGRPALTLFLAGLLLVLAAACGGGKQTGTTAEVQEEIQIGDTEAAGSEGEAPEVAVAQVPPQPPRLTGEERDPFANPTAARPELPVAVPVETPETPPSPPEAGPPEGTGPEVPVEPTYVPPDFKVTGILRSPTGDKAILTGPEQSYIVSEGDKIGDYRVASISGDKVTIRYKDHEFSVELEQEFSVKNE